MPRASFRFLHAGDFRLHLPVHGLAETPKHLKDLMVDAPRQAARRVFDAVQREQVDFVVLTGDLLDAEHAGAGGVAFLMEQFERMARRGVEVFWAGAAPKWWTDKLPLPANVHLFPQGRWEGYTVRRGAHRLARVIGTSNLSHQRNWPPFNEADAGLFTVTVAPWAPAQERRIERDTDYWAVVGGEAQDNPLAPQSVIHNAGSPQGRSPAEPGPHGCALVEASADRRTHLRQIETDAVRFAHERLTTRDCRLLTDLENEAHRRIEHLQDRAANRIVIVKWTIHGHGRVIEDLLAGGDQGLLRRLRERHAHGAASVWSDAIDLAPSANHTRPASALDNDGGGQSHLEEYLHTLGRWAASEPAVFNGHPAFDEVQDSLWREAGTIAGSPSRQEVARHAARLGGELLAQGGAHS